MSNKVTILPNSTKTDSIEQYYDYSNPLIYTESAIVPSTSDIYCENQSSILVKTAAVAAIAFFIHTTPIPQGGVSVQSYQTENTSINNAFAYEYIRKQEKYLEEISMVVNNSTLEEEERYPLLDSPSDHFLSDGVVNLMVLGDELFSDSKPLVGKELDYLVECLSLNSPSKPSLPNRL